MKLNIHRRHPLSTRTHHYKMMTVTTILTVIIMLFFSGKANPESYDNTIAISAKKSSFTHFADASDEWADNDVSDKDLLSHFLHKSDAVADNGYPVLMSYQISDTGKKTRLNALLDYESRAP